MSKVFTVGLTSGTTYVWKPQQDFVLTGVECTNTAATALVALGDTNNFTPAGVSVPTAAFQSWEILFSANISVKAKPFPMKIPLLQGQVVYLACSTAATSIMLYLDEVISAE